MTKFKTQDYHKLATNIVYKNKDGKFEIMGVLKKRAQTEIDTLESFKRSTSLSKNDLILIDECEGYEIISLISLLILEKLQKLKV